MEYTTTKGFPALQPVSLFLRSRWLFSVYNTCSMANVNSHHQLSLTFEVHQHSRSKPSINMCYRKEVKPALCGTAPGRRGRCRPRPNTSQSLSSPITLGMFCLRVQPKDPHRTTSSSERCGIRRHKRYSNFPSKKHEMLTYSSS